MTGIRPTRGFEQVDSMSNASPFAKMIEKLQIALKAVHRDVEDRTDKEREQARTLHNSRTNVKDDI